MSYKTITENGTKKYLVKFVGSEYWMPTTNIFQESFIQGETYKVFKMKQGGIMVQGKIKNEADKIYSAGRLRYPSQFTEGAWEYVRNNNY